MGQHHWTPGWPRAGADVSDVSRLLIDAASCCSCINPRCSHHKMLPTRGGGIERACRSASSRSGRILFVGADLGWARGVTLARASTGRSSSIFIPAGTTFEVQPSVVPSQPGSVTLTGPLRGFVPTILERRTGASLCKRKDGRWSVLLPHLFGWHLLQP